jgi:hypothetical protein
VISGSCFWPGYYPAVVDVPTFQAAQVARQRNLAIGRGRKGHDITNIFTGLTTCESGLRASVERYGLHSRGLVL